VKLVALLADALLDLTHRGEVMLDPFLGSGSTLIAAERTGRVCREVELDLLYVDLMLRRYAEVAGGPVTLESTGETKYLDFFSYPTSTYVRLLYTAANLLSTRYGGFEGALTASAALMAGALIERFNGTSMTIALLTALGQAAIVTFGGAVFKVQPLDGRTWLAIVAGTSSVIVFAEAVRFFGRR